MIRKNTSSVDELEMMAPILRVLEDVTARRIAGEAVSDEAVKASHPDLMPTLGEKLAAEILEAGGTDLIQEFNLI